MKKYLIITASDRKYGEFLIKHWLKSLQENVNLTDIDIAVVDYGFSQEQKSYLEANGVIIYPGNRDGHVTSVRFREIASFLKENNYQQVLACDSGDIIFQKDISNLFNENKEDYRAVYDDYKFSLSYFLKEFFFDRSLLDEIKKSLEKNNMINAGMIIASGEKMQYLSEQITEIVKDNSTFGPDQIVVNYILHRDGFVQLNKKFNFVLNTVMEEFSIVDGMFKLNEEIIPIVHNSGNFERFRVIENFGYGKEYNVLKKEYYKSIQDMRKNKF